MKVTVNDQVVETPLDKQDTLDALLDGLRESGRIPADQAMVHLEVDGRSWKVEDMDGLDQTRLSDLQQVAISTADLRGYARRIVTDAASIVPVLVEATRQVALKLRRESPEEANARLFELLDALHHLLICLYRVQNVCGLRCNPLDSGQQVVQRITAGLRSIRTSQETQDWDALAHQLEQDLLPAMEGFADVIGSMKEELQDGNSNTARTDGP